MRTHDPGDTAKDFITSVKLKLKWRIRQSRILA